MLIALLFPYNALIPHVNGSVICGKPRSLPINLVSY
jgi:hypothetical protein